MKRRTLLGIGIGAVAVSTAPIAAQDRLTLSIQSNMPDNAAALANRIAAASGGTITLDVQTVGNDAAPALLDTVSGGDADMYLTSEEAFIGKSAAFGLFSSMPGGMSPSELESWIIVSDGRFMWDVLGEENGIKSFLAGDMGPTPLWSKAPLTDVASLTSGKVGSSGLAIAALQAMGAADVVDIYASSTDLASLSVIDGMSVTEMAQAGLLASFPHMTAANALHPMRGLSAGINLTRWNSLSDEQRQLIERCIMAEHGTGRAAALHSNAMALVDAGDSVTKHAMPDDIWAAQISASNTVMSSMIEGSNTEADAADAYLYFISDVAGWSEIGEAAFFQGRNATLSQ